jgi:hypothetical protein
MTPKELNKHIERIELLNQLAQQYKQSKSNFEKEVNTSNLQLMNTAENNLKELL